MKQLLFFLIMALLTSCMNSIYHVSSVQSEQVRLVDKDFVVDNEHLSVLYDLWAEGGRMRFLVFNKTDQPLYIDWSKSFIVTNTIKLSYSDLPVWSTQVVRKHAYVYKGTFVEPYRVTAQGNSLTEIPSQTFVAIADIPIQQMVLNRRSKEKYFVYNQTNSPLRLSHELSYSFSKTLVDSHIVVHSFWLDKLAIIRRAELIRQYGSLEKGQPNAFYTVEKQGAPVRIVAITAAVVALTYKLVIDSVFSDFTLW